MGLVQSKSKSTGVKGGEPQLSLAGQARLAEADQEIIREVVDSLVDQVIVESFNIITEFDLSASLQLIMPQFYVFALKADSRHLKGYQFSLGDATLPPVITRLVAAFLLLPEESSDNLLSQVNSAKSLINFALSNKDLHRYLGSIYLAKLQKLKDYRSTQATLRLMYDVPSLTGGKYSRFFDRLDPNLGIFNPQPPPQNQELYHAGVDGDDGFVIIRV